MVFISFLIFSPISKSSCQEAGISFQKYSTREGLSQSSIVTIYQDDEGFMWFGTYGGLNRFDGYNFKVFQPSSDNPNTISDNHVRTICQDTSGILWVGTTNGLNRFFTHTNEFVHFKNIPGDTNSIAANAVYKVFKDRDGDIWVGTWGGGLDKMECIEDNYSDEKDAGYRFVHYSSGTHNFNEKYISDITEGTDGSLYIASSFLYRLDKKTEKFTVYRNEPGKPDCISSRNISSVCTDKTGYIWAGAWEGGLNRLDPETGTITQFYHDPGNKKSLSHNIIMRLYCDSEGNIWVGTWGGGLNRITPPSPVNNSKIKPAFNDYIFSRYQHNETDQYSLSGNSIYSIFEDLTGSIWIGTDWSGISKFDNSTSKFRHFYKKDDTPNSLINNVIHALFIDKQGKLWVGTQEGLNVYNKQKDIFKAFQQEPYNSSSLSFNQVRSIIEDQEGNIWIGTMKGLNKYNPRTGLFKRYYINPDDPGSTNNLALHVTRDGNVWIGNYSGGLFVFDPRTEKFRVYSRVPGDDKSISDNQIWDIIEDSAGMMWIATGKGGLNKFDPETQSFISYQNDPKDTTGISSNTVWTLFIDKMKNFWIGTTHGLNKLVYDDHGKAVFMKYLNGPDIPDKGITGIVEDSFNQLWITTSKGIVRFDPENNRHIMYGLDDGLLENEFSINAIIRDENTGEIYAGGINGFSVFDPENVKENDIPPIVKIIDLKLFNRSVSTGDTVNGRILLQKSIHALDNIRLLYKENAITFEYVAMHYKLSESNQYAFKLDGFDKGWNYVGNQRMATYTNLEPGYYKFRVKACNSDNIWNEEGTTLDLYIKPPYWQTWLFRISSFLFLSALLLLIFFVRIRQIRSRNIYLERAVRERTKEIDTKNRILNESNQKLGELNVMKDKFFSIIGHDLKNPINAIMGFSFLLRERIIELSADKRDYFINAIYKSARNTSELLENLLQWANSQKGQMNYKPKELNIEKLIKENINLCKEQADEKNIGIEFSSQKSDFNAFCDPRMISTVLRNLLVNAIKFSNPDTQIQVSLSDKDKKDYLIINIIDQGIGLNENQLRNLFSDNKSITMKGTSGEPGTGLGLELCKEFVRVNNGEIWVKSKPGIGSTFSFSLPVKKPE